MGFCDTCNQAYDLPFCLAAGPLGVPCVHGWCDGHVDTECSHASYEGPVDPRRNCVCLSCSSRGSIDNGYETVYASQALASKAAVERIHDTPRLKEWFVSGLDEVIERLRFAPGKRLSSTVDAGWCYVYKCIADVADIDGKLGLAGMGCPQRCPIALQLLDTYEERGFTGALVIRSKCAGGSNIAMSGGCGRHAAFLEALAGDGYIVLDFATRATQCCRRQESASFRRLGICIDPTRQECWLAELLLTKIVLALKAISPSAQITIATNWCHPMLTEADVRLAHWRFVLGTIQCVKDPDSRGGLWYRLARHIQAMEYLKVSGGLSYSDLLARLPVPVARYFATPQEVDAATSDDFTFSGQARFMRPGSHELTPEERAQGCLVSGQRQRAKSRANSVRQKQLEKLHEMEALRRRRG